MKAITKILITLGVILALIAAVFFTAQYKDKQLAEQALKLKKEILKNDTLIQLNEELFTKRIADTVKISELKRLNDSLKLEIKDPTVIGTIVLKPKDTKGEIDIIEVKDSIISITDYYPDKENPFITYSADVNKNTEKGIGEFKMGNLYLDFGVGQNPDGTYSLNTKVPDFIKVENIKVQSLPIEPIKRDRFGYLLGAGVGKSMINDVNFIYISTGVRINKFYIEAYGTSLQTISTGVKFEF